MPSQIERIKELEVNQKRHEERCAEDRAAQADLETRVSDLHAQVQLMAVTVDGLDPRLASMDKSLKALADDKRDRDTLAGDRRSRKLDAKDWLLVLVAIVSVIIALPAAVQAIKEILK